MQQGELELRTETNPYFSPHVLVEEIAAKYNRKAVLLTYTSCMNNMGPLLLNMNMQIL